MTATRKQIERDLGWVLHLGKEDAPATLDLLDRLARHCRQLLAEVEGGETAIRQLEAAADTRLACDSDDVQQVTWDAAHLAERFRQIAAERDALAAEVARLRALNADLCERTAAAAAVLAARAEGCPKCRELRAALAVLLDGRGPCRPDHHGFCQSHHAAAPCPVGAARALVGERKSDAW